MSLMASIGPSAALSFDASKNPHPQTSRGRIALVCMPWGSIVRPSLAMGILKRCAQAAGFDVDMHYLNLHLAKRLGLELYEKVVERSVFHTEWFFSQALFGPGGMAEVKNSWDDLLSDPEAQPLLEQLQRILDDSSEACRKIATEVTPFIQACMSQIDWTKYLAVGFTTTFAQSLASLLLAKHIKEQHPQVQIVIGGANVDSEMGVEFVRAFPWVDYVVHGEAEKSFPLLLDNLASGRFSEKVSGVSMRQNGSVVAGDSDAVPVVDLNETPTPDYSDYVRQLELSGLRKQVPLTLYFESSRGCWWGAKHHCTFCGLNGSTMAFRKKDSARVYSEILELAGKYHCLTLSATDNILANEYFKDLLPRLGNLNVDLSLFYEVKANLTRNQLKALHDAGINLIQPGIESFNSRILQLMRKGVSAIQNIQLLKWCEELAIGAAYNILFGFPGEVPEDYADLPRIFRLLSHLRPPSFIVPVEFERFSPYFFEKEKFGLQLKPRAHYEYIFPRSRVNLEKIAYFFEGTWKDQIGAPGDYIGPTKEAFETWARHRETGKIFCYYEKGPSYLVIHDNRPRMLNGPIEARRLNLNEPYSSIYLFCDENRSLRAVHEMMKKTMGDSLSENT
ncbi:MAG TPA: RiPP maturation radical SAM C-methyltransferase, partial [Candidatus Angelobacter sp.]